MYAFQFSRVLSLSGQMLDAAGVILETAETALTSESLSVRALAGDAPGGFPRLPAAPPGVL